MITPVTVPLGIFNTSAISCNLCHFEITAQTKLAYATLHAASILIFAVTFWHTSAVPNTASKTSFFYILHLSKGYTTDCQKSESKCLLKIPCTLIKLVDRIESHFETDWNDLKIVPALTHRKIYSKIHKLTQLHVYWCY